MASVGGSAPLLPGSMRAGLEAWLNRMLGFLVLALCAACAVSLLTWSFADPSFTHATTGPTRNLLGPLGAILSDLVMQLLGLSGVFLLLPPVFWGLQLVTMRRLDDARIKLILAPIAVILLACAASALPRLGSWPLPYSLGGVLGDELLRVLTRLLALVRAERASAAAGLFCCAGGAMLLLTSLGLSRKDLELIWKPAGRGGLGALPRRWLQRVASVHDQPRAVRREPTLDLPPAAGPEQRPSHFELALERRRPAPLAPRAADPPRLPQHVTASADEPDADGVRRMARMFAPRGGAAASRDDDAHAPTVAPEPLLEKDDPIAAAEAVRQRDERPRVLHRQHAGAGPADLPEPSFHVEPAAPAAWVPRGARADDALYGRAVAVVLNDRRASVDYLRQRLTIGYMCAADLLERMEDDGILGPACNGMWPILKGGPGSREV